jgi:hypothetical protein
VRGLAARHARLADLALSFPALLFALAVPRRGLDPACAIARAVEGAALAAVAAAAGVPLWLRRVPPEALAAPLGKLPDSPSFRCRIANHLPSRKLAPVWLRAVSQMADLADEAAAVWVAREVIRDGHRVKLDRLQLIGLWAWFSNRPGTLGYGMLDRRWAPDIRLGAARDAAEEWRTTITLHLNLGRAPIADLWLRPACVGGYDFHPLASAHEVAEEAAALSNCLRTYGENLAHNRNRLWSLRKDGHSIAALSIAFHHREPLPYLVELKAAGNADAPIEAWRAARQWLQMQDCWPADPKRRPWNSVPLDRATWTALWRPYWLARRRLPDWLPLAPSRDALGAL